MNLDLTVTTAELASAASALVRLVPGKLIDPVDTMVCKLARAVLPPCAS